MTQDHTDLDLDERQVEQLSSRDAVAEFFALLGYDTSARTLQTPANLGITAGGLTAEIRHAELIADEESQLQVYLFELTSVTVAATQGLARAFRNRAGNFLLVLTSDYERLDFVLLERFVPDSTGGGGPGGRRGVGVRPRVLSIERRKPSRVEMRVLRRFTYTEGDPIAQYEKLLSAYAIVDWGEEHFNNRALFSDYYLTERLRETTDWREENPLEAYRAFRRLFHEARTRWAQKPARDFRQGVVEPALRELGFLPVAGERTRGRAHRYVLHSPDDGSKLAVCLAYPWGRSLDGKDYIRDEETREENPGAMVVSLLRDDEAKWAIVTNGKHWRLYSARSDSWATNYYEVDLEEVLAAKDPSEAFRYFWLLFRRQAFEPRKAVRRGQDATTTFLDLVLEGSQEYAKCVGDRLKKRVFEEVFPQLARGFVEYRKAREGVRADLGQEALDGVFQGTLTLLYRLLFLLYAEARDLLPAKEVRGYYELSLTRIKRDVAEALGDDPEDVARRLRLAYRTNSTCLYDRLLALFCVIDRGNRDLNVPVYNGGLFISEPRPDDDTPEARNARFLLANKVPDRYLAAALDLLARDEDEKTGKLVFIDYKSLGVRQLGSIYEGLLEFRLRIAPEKMAVCKGGKVEEIIPYREAVQKKRQILRQGHGKHAPERIYPKGAVYLENSRHERKATGSYYTPDYIVKYIVEHTVRPVLEEKFEAVRPKLRKAERMYHEARKRAAEFEKAGLTADDPEKVANSDFCRGVVEELFDVKVLDPAMGSGHFLVEAVDFITDRMIDFLNAFPWNPVTAMLRQTREAILREMDEQGITIDRGHLTDVNLLKRHVLKRCIYGVDLNPMAVELAKVSLWLHCFTLGAPLSFLDHHLRCGNSLIGARVEEVEQAIRGDKVTGQTQAHLQLSLQAGPLVGLLSATEMMRRVGELSDVTPRMVAESRDAYHKALDALAPIKRALDLYVAQWFVDAEPRGRRRRGQPPPEHPLLRFLRSEHAEACIKDPAACAMLPDEDRRLVESAFAEAAQRRFFHWELEFPEVWYEQGRRKENPGFDAVVGNPPYAGVRTGSICDKERAGIVATYRTAQRNWDIFGAFVERGLAVLSAEGSFGFIVPERLGSNRDLLPVRQLFIKEGGPSAFVACGKAFEDPTVRAAVVVHNRRRTNTRVYVGSFIRGTGRTCGAEVPLADISRLPDSIISGKLGASGTSLALRLAAESTPLGSVADIVRGMECGRNDPNVLAAPDGRAVPVLSGEGVLPYRVREQGMYIRLGLSPESRYKRPELFQARPKVLVRFVAREPVAALDLRGYANFNTVYNVLPKGGVSAALLTAVLNSAPVRWWFRGMYASDEELFPHVQKYQLGQIPIVQVAVPSQVRESLQTHIERIVSSSIEGDPADLMPTLGEVVASRLGSLTSAQAADACRCGVVIALEALALAAAGQGTSPISRIQRLVDSLAFALYGLDDAERDLIAEQLAEAQPDVNT